MGKKQISHDNMHRKTKVIIDRFHKRLKSYPIMMDKTKMTKSEMLAKMKENSNG